MQKPGLSSCCYRVETDEASSTVLCRRLLELADLKETQWGQIGRDACRACQGASAPVEDFYNDVLASLLFQLARRIEATGGIPKCSLEQAGDLKALAADGIRGCQSPRANVKRVTDSVDTTSEKATACDVVVNLSQLSSTLTSTVEAAIESLFHQENCTVTVHLVSLHATTREVSSLYANQENVLIHELDQPVSDMQAVHAVVPKCRSEFVAIQTLDSISLPSRFAFAVNQLQLHGGDIFGSAALCGGELIPAMNPLPLEYRRTIPPETLVFQRSSFIDAGGVGTLSHDHDLGFIHRCALENRKFVLADALTVQCENRFQPEPIEKAPDYQLEQERLVHYGTGFPMQRVACDVVLPFRDHLDYVEEAIESILNQENCDVILHLIDDASTASTEAFFQRWQKFSNVRCYRNERNLGQYSSFNNVVSRLETDFVAIQDGDDISHPDRISTAVNSLLLSNADIFCGLMEMFGATMERSSKSRNDDVKMRPIAEGTFRRSVIPGHIRTRSVFAMNASAVFRVETFRALGGFTDYGSTARNRCALDSEFYLRAFLSREARFFISKHMTGRYRRHEDSATQNDTTGFGTPIREQNRDELLRRKEIYLNSEFSAKEFGALGRYQHLTHRLK